MGETDPGSLAAAERLRRAVAPEDAAWALSQASLRRRAVGKLGRAAEMLFTPDGLEQASRDAVARWRARRFAEAGVREVWDLGCGIGADAMAFAAAGMRVVAVEADPAAAAVAAHNLALAGGGEVWVGLAEEALPPEDAALFLDPARRTARGRSWDVADFAPPWEHVLSRLAGPRFTVAKLGPGLPKQLIPDGVQACWVSHAGHVVEVSLWNRRPAGRRAVVLESSGEAHELEGPAAQHALPVGPVGRYLIEPDGAVIRSGLLTAIAPGHDLWLLDEHVAYLASDTALISPFSTCFEVVEVLDHDVKTLRAWVRGNAVGALEIKKRAVDVDPAQLRRRLRPKGPKAATLVLARTGEGVRALVVRRVDRGSP